MFSLGLSSLPASARCLGAAGLPEAAGRGWHWVAVPRRHSGGTSALCVCLLRRALDNFTFRLRSAGDKTKL